MVYSQQSDRSGTTERAGARMITQIEIDGFKTFLDFKVELGPFQVLVGSNASGKSNLFDALHLLSRLAEVDLRSAFQGLRGSPDDQFTLFPNGQRSDHIRIAVEMLVDRKAQDELGQKTELTYIRLRYEIAVTFRTDTYGLQSPYVVHESLQSIPPDKDNWSREHGLFVQNGWLLDTATDQKTFIDTKPSKGRITKSVTPLAESQIDISRDMANLVPGFHRVKVEKDDSRGDYEIVVETVDEHIQPAQVLSDGTLRLLALAAIRNDPEYHGVLCLEEPENGVHPLHLHEMARILREMATDFHDPRQVSESLKQVLITTHSPIFISQPEIIDALLLVITPRRVRYHNIPSVRLTQMVPVLMQRNHFQLSSDPEDRAVDIYTIDMVRKYLESGFIDEALKQLEQSRETLTR